MATEEVDLETLDGAEYYVEYQVQYEDDDGDSHVHQAKLVEGNDHEQFAREHAVDFADPPVENPEDIISVQEMETVEMDSPSELLAEVQ